MTLSSPSHSNLPLDSSNQSLSSPSLPLPSSLPPLPPSPSPNLIPIQPLCPQPSPILSTSPINSPAAPSKITTLVPLSTFSRARASSWSNIFRRQSLSAGSEPPPVPASSQDKNTPPPLLSTHQVPPPVSAPPSGKTPDEFKPTHTPTASAPFSLSSLASALKRPLSLTTPVRLGPAPSPMVSPADSRATHDLSPRQTDPDPTPSVPVAPQLVVEDEPASVPFDFNLFLEQMRWAQAEPIAKYLRSFLKEFAKRAGDAGKQIGVTEQVRVVNDFLDFISVKMREIKDGPWDPRRCSDAEFDNAVEAMEKLVMNRVWHQTFTPALAVGQPSHTDDIERDTVLAQKMKLFSWINDRHLDLCLPPDEADGFLEFAKTELLKINAYKAPRDKMICILNCCKVIFGLIRHVSQTEGGADTFVPILILVVLRAQPQHLISNVQFIQRFRNPDKMQGENGYYLSSLNAAISFIERLEHSVLSNITQSEFEYNVEQAIGQLPRSPLDPTPSAGSSGLSGLASVAASAQTVRESASGGSLPDMTRSWLFSTVPQLAEKAVSRPLNAIARIVDDLAASETEERDGRGGPPSPTRRVPLHEPRRASASGGLEQQQQHPQTRPRGTRPWSVDSPRTTARALEGQLSPTTLGLTEEDVQRIESLKRAEHEAKLETLASIFPRLEKEVLEIVLITHHGVVSRAIDSLLEMS